MASEAFKVWGVALAAAAVSDEMDSYESEEETQEAEYTRLVKLRAQSSLAVTKAKESEARALAQQNGSLTEKLRREQKKLRKAVARANSAEAAAAEAQQACKELQYANRKLQQELNSTQVAAKLASDRSSRCLRNLRDTLYNVEVETSSRFTRGQQHVQQLIVLTKRLQSQAAGSSTSCVGAGNSSSPCQHQQSFSSTAVQRVISEMFRTLAALGELLTPSPSLLQEAELDAAAVEQRGGAAAISCDEHDDGNSSKFYTRRQRPATATADRHKDAQCLAAQTAVLQTQLDDALNARAALQRQCADLQQQLQQQVDSSAAAASSSRLECVQQLAEVMSLQAGKQQLQQQVDALQRSYAASQSALQLLRDDHAEQTSRLAAANAEVLRLQLQVSSLEAELVQQQFDVASALSIVSGREAAAVLPLGGSGLSAACCAQDHLCVQQRRQPWQQAACEGEISQTGQAELGATTAGGTALGMLRKNMKSPRQYRPAHHVTTAIRGQQSQSPGDRAPAFSSTPNASVQGEQACQMLSGASELAQQVHNTAWGVPVPGTGAGSNAQVGTAEQALQHRPRGPMLVQPLAGPGGTVGTDASGAAAGGGNAAGQAMSPATRYSALVADADTALQRLAECRKAAAAGMNSSAVLGHEYSPVRASGRLGASRQSVVGTLGYFKTAGSTKLASAGSTHRQLFSSGRGDAGYGSKMVAGELLERAAAAAWAVPAASGDTHSSSVACTSDAVRLVRMQQVGSMGRRSTAMPHTDSGELHDSSSRLRLHELHAELQAMDGDIEAAEAALQAATARFSTQTAG